MGLFFAEILFLEPLTVSVMQKAGKDMKTVWALDSSPGASLNSCDLGQVT